MSIASISSTLLGGLGLFLVGMWLMTDGLKLAAGNSLRQLLRNWTNTRQRGLTTGFLITALVQSSSAVTVATIGFANAGLLSLSQAVWVIFGSNVGTTMTGWLVVLIGFKISIEAFALPLIGIGMMVKLIGRKGKWSAIGQAIVGFGLFFLGISILKGAFESVGSSINLPGVQDAGFSAIFLYVLLGMILTTLMQSSSAAIVITLSAAEGGLIPLGAAAATVIGANLGTTTTAILSVWGATSTAKRVAVSHVLFNIMTAMVAIIILVPMLAVTNWVQTTLNLSPSAATTLAIFHSVFNILGVILIWPLANHLIKFLSERFVSEEEIYGKPQYLDQTALEVPALASLALMKEINRLNQRSVSVAMDAISSENNDSERFSIDQTNVEKLSTSIGDYIANLSKTNLSEEIANLLPELVRVVQQYVTIIDLSQDVVSLQKDIDTNQGDILEGVVKIKHDAALILQHAEANDPQFNPDSLQHYYDELEKDFDALRFAILKAGADGSMGMVTVDNQLQQVTIIKRIAKQIIKTAIIHQQLITNLSIEPLSLTTEQTI